MPALLYHFLGIVGDEFWLESTFLLSHLLDLLEFVLKLDLPLPRIFHHVRRYLCNPLWTECVLRFYFLFEKVMLLTGLLDQILLTVLIKKVKMLLQLLDIFLPNKVFLTLLYKSNEGAVSVRV